MRSLHRKASLIIQTRFYAGQGRPVCFSGRLASISNAAGFRAAIYFDRASPEHVPRRLCMFVVKWSAGRENQRWSCYIGQTRMQVFEMCGTGDQDISLIEVTLHHFPEWRRVSGEYPARHNRPDHTKDQAVNMLVRNKPDNPCAW